MADCICRKRRRVWCGGVRLPRWSPGCQSPASLAASCLSSFAPALPPPLPLGRMKVCGAKRAPKGKRGSHRPECSGTVPGDRLFSTDADGTSQRSSAHQHQAESSCNCNSTVVARAAMPDSPNGRPWMRGHIARRPYYYMYKTAPAPFFPPPTSSQLDHAVSEIVVPSDNRCPTPPPPVACSTPPGHATTDR